MTQRAQPFPAELIQLPSFSLSPIAQDEAGDMAQALASMDPWRTLGYRPQSLRSYLQRVDPALSRYKVRSSGNAAGVVCVRYPWLLGPYIEMLALFETSQGMGLGADLVSWIEARAKLSPARNVWATVSSFNTRALSFYTRIGFTEAAPLKDLVRAGYDEILIRKKLG